MQPLDVLDENVNLPYLVISKDNDPHEVFHGFFETPSTLVEDQSAN
jgi:hypothetical protein